MTFCAAHRLFVQNGLYVQSRPPTVLMYTTEMTVRAPLPLRSPVRSHLSGDDFQFAKRKRRAKGSGRLATGSLGASAIDVRMVGIEIVRAVNCCAGLCAGLPTPHS